MYYYTEHGGVLQQAFEKKRLIRGRGAFSRRGASFFRRVGIFYGAQGAAESGVFAAGERGGDALPRGGIK
jgi:hypothetical protein